MDLVIYFGMSIQNFIEYYPHPANDLQVKVTDLEILF